MARRGNPAATRGAQINTKRVDFVGGMARSLSPPPLEMWNVPSSLPRAAMPRPRIPLPEGSGKSSFAIRKRTSVLPPLVYRPPFITPQPPQTFPTRRKLVPGFTSPVSLQDATPQPWEHPQAMQVSATDTIITLSYSVIYDILFFLESNNVTHI
jgi:hypothetical protein